MVLPEAALLLGKKTLRLQGPHEASFNHPLHPFEDAFFKGPAEPLGAVFKGPAEPLGAVLEGTTEPLEVVLEGPEEPLEAILEGSAEPLTVSELFAELHRIRVSTDAGLDLPEEA